MSNIFKFSNPTYSLQTNPGELIQILNAESVDVELNSADKLNPKIAEVHSGGQRTYSRNWPISLSDTVEGVMNRWLADAPVISISDTAKMLGLDDSLSTTLSNADDAVFYKLNLLKAILMEADIICFERVPDELTNFGAFYWDIQKFISSHYNRPGYCPSCVVFESDHRDDVMYSAAKVYENRNGKLHEMTVEIF